MTDKEDRVDSRNSAARSTGQNGPTVKELLCYVVKKVDIIPYDMLVKICSDHFSESEVEGAKHLIISLCGDSHSGRIPRRIGNDQKVKCMK